MKFIFTYTALFFSPFLIGQIAVDTVSIVDTIGQNPMPYRFCNINAPKQGFLDSIISGRTIINKGNQDYYLKVYNSDTTLVLEGDFYDKYPSGLLFRYNNFGLLTDSLTYELTNREKPKKEVCSWKSPAGGHKFKFKYFTFYDSKIILPSTYHTYKKDKLIKTTRIGKEGKVIIEYNTEEEIQKSYIYDNKGNLLETKKTVANST